MSELQTADVFTDESLVQDPESYYEFVRSHGPVWQEPVHGIFYVTGYEEICSIFRDPETFSSVNAFWPFLALPERPHGNDVSSLIEKYRHLYPGSAFLAGLDPPEHTAHRGLMNRLLTPRRLQENEEFMWRAADALIDEFVENGKCEFISEYAQPFALAIIADLLGVPEADHAALRAEVVGAGQPGALGKPLPSNPFEFLDDWFIRYVEDRRSNPRHDVLTRMALATFPDGSIPEVTDVAHVATFLFAGGQGTSARFLGNMFQQLGEHPELEGFLLGDRSRIANFVEESLRLKSPARGGARMVRRSTTIAGVHIPAGSTVISLLPAGDRDPQRFDGPTEFRADRPNAREHVAFGRGIHSCPGAPLVRADARVTLERFLDRTREIRISAAEHGPAGDRRWDYTKSWKIRGLNALHLTFRPIGSSRLDQG
jgi:cytochrome P450